MNEPAQKSQKLTASKHDFKFSQVFGDKISMEKAQDQDLISCLQFDKTGKYLSLGDRAGRLIIFEEKEQGKHKGSKYQYMTELQSHVKEFDYLKSTDIDEKVNSIQWLKPQGDNLQLITTNDKTIKVWKLWDKEVKQVAEGPQGQLQDIKDVVFPRLQTLEKGWLPSLNKTFPNLHQYLINSISVASNEEYMISNDDLKVYLWDLHKPHSAYNVIDIKPNNMDDVQEVITCSKYHPKADNIFVYATSQGQMSLCDLRKSALSARTAVNFENIHDKQQRNFFSDFVESIGDICFTSNSRQIVTRDFLTVKVWDINMPNKPVEVTNIYEPIKQKLCELYENEQILQKFNVACSPDSNTLLTGNFNSTFHLINRKEEHNLQYEINFKQRNIISLIPQKHFEMLGPNYNFEKKISNCAFHPTKNIISIACLNTLFFYQAI